MPELCRIYIPMMDRRDGWFLKTRIIFYKGTAEGWAVTIDDQVITVKEFDELKKVVDFVAARNDWYTDYKEAKNFIARQK